MAETTVKVNFVGDTKDLNRAIDDVDGRASKLTPGLLAMGGAAVAGGAALFSMAEAAAEDEKAAKALETTLKNVTGATDAQVAGLEDWITAQGKAFGVADDDLRPALDSLVRATGDVTKSQKLASLAMDISAGTGKDLTTVTDALSKAANGNMKSLRSLSPELTGLISEGASAEEVFDKLGETFEGQAAAAAETTAGKLQIAKLQFAEMQEEIGAKVLPVMIKFANFVQNRVVPAIAKMFEIVQRVVKFFRDHMEVTVGLVTTGLVALTAAVIAALPALAAKAAAWWAVAAGVIAANAPMIAIAAAIGALVAGVIYAYKEWDWFRKTVDTVAAFLTGTLWPAIQTIVTWLKDHLGPVITAVASFFADTLWPAMQKVAGFVTDNVIPAVQRMIEIWWGFHTAVFEIVRQVIEKVTEIVTFVAGLPGTIAEKAANLWEGLKSGLEEVVRWILEQLDKVMGPLDEAIGKLDSILKKSGLVGSGSVLKDYQNSQRTGSRAGGGPVWPGTWLVGERGPELLHMGGSGHVTPNHAMGGGVVVNVNAPVYGVDHLERVVIEAVRSYERRNGRAA